MSRSARRLECRGFGRRPDRGRRRPRRRRGRGGRRRRRSVDLEHLGIERRCSCDGVQVPLGDTGRDKGRRAGSRGPVSTRRSNDSSAPFSRPRVASGRCCARYGGCRRARSSSRSVLLAQGAGRRWRRRRPGFGFVLDLSVAHRLIRLFNLCSSDCADRPEDSPMSVRQCVTRWRWPTLTGSLGRLSESRAVEDRASCPLDLDRDDPPRESPPRWSRDEGGRASGLERLDGVAHDLAVVSAPPRERPGVGQAARVAGCTPQLPARQPRREVPRDLRSFGGLQAYPSRSKDPDPVDYSTGSVGIGATAPIWGALARRYVR